VTDEPVIAGAVIARDDHVLLIRRAAPENGLVWQFPAGKVEQGEPPERAAAREALEEAGVTVVPAGVIGTRVHPGTGRRVVYVACRWVSGDPRPASPREVAAAEWVPITDLADWIPGGVYPPVQEYLDGVLPH
jgi:8-oxo-dGTP diphosphatase